MQETLVLELTEPGIPLKLSSWDWPHLSLKLIKLFTKFFSLIIVIHCPTKHSGSVSRSISVTLSVSLSSGSSTALHSITPQDS